MVGGYCWAWEDMGEKNEPGRQWQDHWPDQTRVCATHATKSRSKSKSKSKSTNDLWAAAASWLTPAGVIINADHLDIGYLAQNNRTRVSVPVFRRSIF